MPSTFTPPIAKVQYPDMNIESRIQDMQAALTRARTNNIMLTSLDSIANSFGRFQIGEIIAGVGTPEGGDLTGVALMYPPFTVSGVDYNVLGMNNGVLQFGLSAVDGKAYAGAGAVILDNNGIHTVLPGIFSEFNDIDIYGNGSSGDIGLQEMIPQQGLYSVSFFSNSKITTPNGDFETGTLSGWTTTGGSPAVVTTQAHSPTHSLNLPAAGAGVISATAVPVTGTAGLVRFWWFPTTAFSDVLTVQIKCYDINHNALSIPVANQVQGVPAGPLANKWYNIALFGAYPPGTYEVKIAITNNGSNMYVDDISFMDGFGSAQWVGANGYVIEGNSQSLLDGWSNDTSGSLWAFSSADAPTFTMTINRDVTALLSPGARIRLKQSQSLTSYWSMDTGSNDSAGTNNGTDTSMTYTAGKFSNAATFNGTASKIAFTDNATLRPTGEFTLGLWFKTGATGVDHYLFQSLSANPNWAGFALHQTPGNVLEVVFGNNTGNVTGVNILVITGKTVITDNVFHYVVVSFRNNYVQMYLDGVLEASGYSFAPVYAATNFVRAGCANGAGTDSNFFSGQIDDMYLINGNGIDENTVKNQFLLNAAQGNAAILLTKYFIVTARPTFSAGSTTITMYGGTDFTLANANISSPAYSLMKAPFGFNSAPHKWSVTVVNLASLSQASPVANTIYNLGSLNIVVPIGAWRLLYVVAVQGVINTGAVFTMTLNAYLSTSIAAADNNMRSYFATTLPISTSSTLLVTMTREQFVQLATKATYNLLESTFAAGLTSLGAVGNGVPTLIQAQCDLL